MIDYNPTTFGIHMQIDEDTSKGFLRYKHLSVPNWFGVRLTPPDFMVTPYVNNLQAFFHYNQGNCQILPATHIINYSNVKMDIDRKLYFIKDEEMPRATLEKVAKNKLREMADALADQEAASGKA